ncbi:MAG: putative toxin-antitoxin system toxin component, PIN family [Actinobacteria bacterium]|nr:MAG: putative toxin-antitoxin system toxin component, PIN family [Actinomycetota bacterium]
MLRVVIDPGVLVSARLSGRGAPGELLRRWLTGHIDIIVSPQLLGELDDVLARTKLRKWLTRAEAETYVEFLSDHATAIEDPPAEPGHTPDADDDYLVSLARVGRADVLVSGDSDLVELADPDPPVLTPRSLVELLDRIERP